MLFAKLKALLREAAERTIASLWYAIGRLLDDFSAAVPEWENPNMLAKYLVSTRGVEMSRG